MKRRNLLRAAVLSLFSLPSLMTQVSAANCPIQIGCTLRMMNMLAPTNVNPPDSLGTWNMDLIGNIYEGLVAHDAQGNSIPGQAERWDVSEDGLIYTFHIRSDAYWSDGHPVLAEHFVRPWLSTFSHKNSRFVPYMLSNVKNASAIKKGDLPVESLGIRALDERTIEITLEVPQTFFPSILAHGLLSPVPLHQLEEYRPTEAWVSGDGRAFNGPFVLEGSLTDAPITLRRNPHFHANEDVYFDSIEIHKPTEEGSAVARFLAGELDIIQMESNQHFDAIEQNDPDMIVQLGVASSTYLMLNTETQELADINVRRAMAMAVLSENLVPVASDTISLETFVPPVIAGYPNDVPQPEWADLPLQERLQLARELMEQAGYGPNNLLLLDFKIIDEQTSHVMSQVLKSLWSQIYVDLTVSANPHAKHYSTDHVRGRNFDIAEIRWFADFNDVYSFMAIFETGGPVNYTGWGSQRYDELLSHYRRSQNRPAQDEMVREMLALTITDVPVIPAYRRTSDSLVQTDLQGFESNPMNTHPLRFVRRSQNY